MRCTCGLQHLGGAAGEAHRRCRGSCKGQERPRCSRTRGEEAEDRRDEPGRCRRCGSAGAGPQHGLRLGQRGGGCARCAAGVLSCAVRLHRAHLDVPGRPLGVPQLQPLQPPAGAVDGRQRNGPLHRRLAPLPRGLRRHRPAPALLPLEPARLQQRLRPRPRPQLPCQRGPGRQHLRVDARVGARSGAEAPDLCRQPLHQRQRLRDEERPHTGLVSRRPGGWDACRLPAEQDYPRRGRGR
mmetsp:Transcript_77796/g.228062  ORF Transcript_77796/g.228062 Transcript_77796/m.228062 type:complete len:240 (+) Transcript_77796:177-896(+)